MGSKGVKCWKMHVKHGTHVGVGLLNCTANDYRQTTDKLIFKHVTSTLRWIRK